MTSDKAVKQLAITQFFIEDGEEMDSSRTYMNVSNFVIIIEPPNDMIH